MIFYFKYKSKIYLNVKSSKRYLGILFSTLLLTTYLVCIQFDLQVGNSSFFLFFLHFFFVANIFFLHSSCKR